MFTFVELTRPDWSIVGLVLSIIADCMFFSGLYWGYKNPDHGEKRKEE